MFSFSWNILGDLTFEQLQKYVGVFLPELAAKPRAEQKSLLQEYLRDADLTPFKEHFASQLLRITGLDKAVPDVYSEFRPVIGDGVRFLLSGIKADRLKEICIEQLLLSPNASTEERLFHLAACMPTLYKLGQIVARNRFLDPRLREWLERLENGYITADLPTLIRTLNSELSSFRADYDMEFEEELLSEASVGAVIGLRWRRRGEREFQRGVVKVLKPGIIKNLGEEISLLKELGEFYENRRADYGLEDFPFRGTTQDIAEALRRETDFSQEQRNLREARRSLGRATMVSIPDLLPFCTAQVTAMQRVEGRKLETSNLSEPECRHMAEKLFRTVIGFSLFGEEDSTLFHGDLHAGNMMTVPTGSAEMPVLALIDWSQAGHLTRSQRELLVKAAIGLFLKDPVRLIQSFEALAEPDQTSFPFLRERLTGIIERELKDKRPGEFIVIKKLFNICDALIREGVKFPSDLLLFRKTVFSFFDVVESLSPTFDADRYLLLYLAPLIAREAGPRAIESCLPGLFAQSKYQTNLPTSDLLQMGVSAGLAMWRRQAVVSFDLLSKTFMGPVPDSHLQNSMDIICPRTRTSKQ